MSQDWDIKPRSDSCHECQAVFTDGQPYFSTLVFGQEGYTRGDYCENCWPAKSGAVSPYSSWKGTYKKPPLQEEVLKKETAESLLRRLISGNDGSRKSAMYILAVMLERKRILVEKDVQKNSDGSLTRVYEHRQTGETFVIPDPQLRLDQLGEVQKDVAALLGGPSQSAEQTEKTEQKEEDAEEDEFDEDEQDDEDEDDDEDDDEK